MAKPEPEKQKFNVYISSNLIDNYKTYCMVQGYNQSRLFERIMEKYLKDNGWPLRTKQQLSRLRNSGAV